jgi:serine/threonine protein kinase
LFFSGPGYDALAARQLVEGIDRELARERGSPPPVVGVTSKSQPPRIRVGLSESNLPRVDFSALTLRRIVGAGRSAKVYEATMNDGGTPVAAKFLRKEFLADPEAVDFFFREGTILRQLDHPHIVRLLGVGETTASGRFLLLDWMVGDLTRHVGKTSWKQGLRWMIEAAEALAAAHHCGVLHCDLKPSNLLLDSSGCVRLGDFGLARTMAEHPAESWILEGTAPYMAPEQASPAWGDISPRTDVFGLGAVFYALLTGNPPWPGKSVANAVTLAASGAKVPEIRERQSDVPEPVARFIARCLAKSPSERFASIDDALQTMRQLECLPDSA